MTKLQLTLRHLPHDASSLQLDRDHVTKQIEAMMSRESSVYKCNDYILSRKLEKITMSRRRSISSEASSQEDFIVDDLCRQKMCEWSYRIVDHFNGSRELVAIAQNYVDRFLDQYRW